MELPESSNWHPLKAAHHYEGKAEEASGKALAAFTEYARLKVEYRERERALAPARSANAIDYTWSQTDTARACASDLNTYTNLARMYAQMAVMKHTRYLSDRAELARSGGTQLL